jgi:hypothetical protein
MLFLSVRPAQARHAMPELHDDRRQEPRFRTAGTALIRSGRKEVRALVLDLSLNGLKIARPDQFEGASQARFPISLSIGQGDPFKAEVKLVHTEPGWLGLEFVDMPPRDFAVLAGIIEQFQRLRRQPARS